MADLSQPAGLVGVWLLGASLGMTACLASCLPFMGSWIVGRGAGGFAAFKDAVLFLAGKLVAYACLGALAGAVGAWLIAALDSGLGLAAVGGASIVAGLWLWRMPRRTCGLRDAGLPPLFLGFSLSLVPCAPLASLLAVAALAGSPWTGLGYGLVFGLGAAATPLLLLAPLLGGFGVALRREQPWLGPWLRRGSGFVLILIGLRRLVLLA